MLYGILRELSHKVQAYDKFDEYLSLYNQENPHLSHIGDLRTMHMLHQGLRSEYKFSDHSDF